MPTPPEEATAKATAKAMAAAKNAERLDGVVARSAENTELRERMKLVLGDSKSVLEQFHSADGSDIYSCCIVGFG